MTASTTIYQGDLVKKVSAGTVEPASSGDAFDVIGVAAEYKVSAATGTYTIRIYDDPYTIFSVQADSGTALSAADIFKTNDHVAGTGNTATKLSGHEFDSSDAGDGSQLRIIGKLDEVGNDWGEHVNLLVIINEHKYKSTNGDSDVPVSEKCKVNEAAGITKGDVVYASGATGGFMRVSLADNTSHDKAHVYGVAAETKSNGETIIIRQVGEISNLDTSTFSAGDRLHLATAGQFQTAVPTNGAHIHVGFVKKSNANTGSISVHPEDFVHDIAVASGQDLELQMGDAAGATKVVFRDYGNVEVGSVDSDGYATFDDLEISNPVQFIEEVNYARGQVGKEPTGFPNQTDSTMSFTDGTRTFTIDKAVTSFDFYHTGVKYTKSAAETLVITDTTGTHYVYYDSTGTLQESVNPTSDTLEELMEDECFCSVIYWNATDGASYYFGDERHGIQMDGSTHAWAHFSSGAAYVAPGLALGDILADQDGSLDTHAQLSLSAGFMEDEDLFFTIAALSAPANIPVMYREAAAGRWVKDAATNFPVKSFSGGSGRLAYNQYTGGAWQQTEVAQLRFVLAHIAVTSEYTSGDRYVAIQGQQTYNTAGEARDGADTELANLVLSGLPSPEMLFIGTVIFQTSTTYTNTPKARIRSTDAGDDYVDWRSTRGVAGGGGGLNAVIEDPSPQLGGDLDANGSTITNLAASTTAAGIVELATTAEIDAATDSTRAMPVDQFAASDFGKKALMLANYEDDVSVATGDGKVGIPIPSLYNGWDIVDAIAVVHTKGVTSTTDIQIRRRRAGSDVDVLSTKITIGDEWYASDGVVNTSNDDLATGDMLYVDIDAVHSGTAPLGLSVAVIIQA
jgi:hypothetical protein